MVAASATLSPGRSGAFRAIFWGGLIAGALDITYAFVFYGLRNGLIFQTRVDITAQRDIAAPTVALSGGWFDGMTLNSVQPAPAKQASAGQGATFAYLPLAAGRTMTVWFEWSVNPTNLAWRRPTVTEIADGGQKLVAQRSTVTVFP